MNQVIVSKELNEKLRRRLLAMLPELEAKLEARRSSRRKAIAEYELYKARPLYKRIFTFCPFNPRNDSAFSLYWLKHPIRQVNDMLEFLESDSDVLLSKEDYLWIIK